MNEKIIELALKAGIERASSSQRAEVLEFAELIVQGCAGLVAEKKTQYEQVTQDFEYESHDWFWAARTTQALKCVEADIKHYFGVEP